MEFADLNIRFNCLSDHMLLFIPFKSKIASASGNFTYNKSLWPNQYIQTLSYSHCFFFIFAYLFVLSRTVLCVRSLK